VDLSNSPSKTGNRLLDALAPAMLAQLRPHLERCDLVFGQGFHQPGETAENVYFPTSGMISVVATMEDGGSVEIGLAGREGMYDVCTILCDVASAQRAIVQLPGSALRMKTRVFRQAMKYEPLRTVLLRYTLATLSAVGQSAACNRLHVLERRCARWLLGAHDRADSDTFPITHELLAMMLGVRRTGVTIAALSLRSAGLITYNHGTMAVIDRAGLEAASCECYRVIQNEYDRIVKA
jgi:CRP-like cAMP-binding protein